MFFNIYVVSNSAIFIEMLMHTGFNCQTLMYLYIFNNWKFRKWLEIKKKKILRYWRYYEERYYVFFEQAQSVIFVKCVTYIIDIEDKCLKAVKCNNVRIKFSLIKKKIYILFDFLSKEQRIQHFSNKKYI